MSAIREGARQAEAAPCGTALLLHQRMVDKLGTICTNHRQGSRSVQDADLDVASMLQFKTENGCSVPITNLTQISMKLVGRPMDIRNLHGRSAMRKTTK